MPRWTSAVGLLALSLGISCSVAWWRGRPVELTPTPQAEHPACRQAAEKLPNRLPAADRSRTSVSSSALAAWGRGQVLWRCGITAPAASARACVRVNGVDWLVTDLRDGTEFTAFGRQPSVQILVREISLPAEILPAFADAASELPQTETCE